MFIIKVQSWVISQEHTATKWQSQDFWTKHFYI